MKCIYGIYFILYPSSCLHYQHLSETHFKYRVAQKFLSTLGMQHVAFNVK